MGADLSNSHDGQSDPARGSGFGRKLMWFVVLWCAGTGTLAAVAFVLRLWIG